MSVRPKIMKLARMIGGVPGMLNKLDENSPEYYCLECVVTDEMAVAGQVVKTTAAKVIKKKK